MSDWLPIESAPDNGTDILGYDKDTGVFHVTSWDGYRWHDPDFHYYSEAESFVPSHWTTIPEPPT